MAAEPLKIVGHLGGAPHDVILREPLAYLATGYAFEVWDLRLPTHPTRAGQLVRRGFQPPPSDGGEGVTRLRIVGDIAYVLDRNMVRIIDISDPSLPRELGFFRLGKVIDDLLVQGTTLYLAVNDRAWGLLVVDASDPAWPVQVRFTADGSYRRLALAGTDLLAFGDLSGGGSPQTGMRAFDLSDPLAPRPVADSMEIRFPAYDLALHAPYLYAAWNDGLHVYDVGDPGNVRKVALFPTVEPVDAVDVTNGVAYLTHGGTVEQVDVTDPAQLRSLGTVAVDPIRGDAGDASIAAGAGLSVVIQRSSGIIRVLDTSEARQMKELARLDSELTVVERIAVAVGTGYAYVPMPDGLNIVDISIPSSPAVVGAYRLPGPSGRAQIADLSSWGTTLQLLVDVDGDHHELQVLDLVVPTSPRHIATVNLGHGIGGGLRARGGTAFVAAYFYDRDKSAPRRLLQVVDLGGPGAPRLVGTAEIDGATPCGECYPELVSATGVTSLE